MTAIDISYWQSHPNFAQVKAAGVTLVIMKAADGEGKSIVDDSVYVANRTAARAQGLAVGSYYFNGPAVSPTAAADHMMGIIDWHDGDVVAIDVEGAAGIVWNPGQVLQWVNQIKAHGVPPQAILVYMSSSLTKSQNWAAVVATGARLWVAQYGTNNGQPQGAPSIGYWPSWTLWQYTSVATCPGVSGHVDTNQIAAGWTPASTTPITEDEDMGKVSNIGVTADGSTRTTAVLWDGGSEVGLVHVQDPQDLSLLQRYVANKVGDIMYQSEIDTINSYIAPPKIATVDVAALAEALAPLLPGGSSVGDLAELQANLIAAIDAVPGLVVKAEGAALANG